MQFSPYLKQNSPQMDSNPYQNQHYNINNSYRPPMYGQQGYYTGPQQHIYVQNQPKPMNGNNFSYQTQQEVPVNRFPSNGEQQPNNQNIFTELSGVGNYPEEWIEEMPDNYNPQSQQYVMNHHLPPSNIPEGINGIYSHTHIDGNFPGGHYNQFEPNMLSHPLKTTHDMNINNPSPVFNNFHPNNFQGTNQSSISNKHNLFFNKYSDDCLYMNLEEEYLHKVSMQPKEEGQPNP